MERVANRDDSTSHEKFWTPEAAEFFRYYRQLQQQSASLVPPRKLFSPAEARSFLPYVSIVEARTTDSYLVRLMGTALVNRTHSNPTGRTMMETMPEDHWETAKAGFRQMLETPCGATYILNEGYDRAPIPVEILSLPFSNASGVPALIISVSVEIDRQQLMLRGEDPMSLRDPIYGLRLIDIARN